MTTLEVGQPQSLDIYNQPAEQRPAFKHLDVEYRNQGIPADKWKLLTAALRSVPDDILERAVIAHMISEYGYKFPSISDIKKQIDLLVPKTPFEVFCQQMARAGYSLVSEHDTHAEFTNGANVATVVY